MNVFFEPNNLEASTSYILQHSFDKNESLPDPNTSINNENSSSETVKKNTNSVEAVSFGNFLLSSLMNIKKICFLVYNFKEWIRFHLRYESNDWLFFQWTHERLQNLRHAMLPLGNFFQSRHAERRCFLCKQIERWDVLYYKKLDLIMCID